MTPDQLHRELSKGKLRPAYLLAGAEFLLRDDALQAIRTATLDPATAEFNLDRLSAQSVTPAALRDVVRTLPVLATHRLVQLSEPELGGGVKSSALVSELAEIVGELSGQSATVLVVTASRVDARMRWVKAFSDPAARVECVPPRGARALTSFLREEALRQEIVLAPGAAELLCERIGPELMMLRQEIAKSALLAGPGQPVTRDHVDAATTPLAETPIWDLTDAIGEGRRADALVQVDRMLGAGAPEVMILGSLAAHFRKLARLRSGGSVKGPPFVTRKLERQAQRYSTLRLRTCLDAIHQTDVALKGAGALPPDLTLERLVLGLAG